MQDGTRRFMTRLRLHPQPAPQQLRYRFPIALRLVLGLALLIVVGTAVLVLVPGMTTRPLTLLEAFFTATSAATVTGLSVVTTSTTFTPLGQFTLLVLIQMGGLGYMVLAILILRLLGRRISLAARLAAASSLGLDHPAGILLLVVRGLGIMLLIEGLGAILLFVHWSLAGIAPPGRVAFYAIFHAVSAFCNAGFDLFSGLPQYPQGLPNDNGTLIILGLLVLAGGLGIPVYSDFVRRRRRLSLHTRLTLATIAFLIIAGWLGLLLTESRPGGVLAELPITSRLVQSLFQSISTRTAGFPGLNAFNDMDQASRLLVFSLMFVGSGPASMGGGITTGTFAVMMLTIASYARGLNRVQFRGRTIPVDTIKRAGAVLTISLLVVIVATWLLLLTHELTLDTALFEVVSALATCGLSLDTTGQLNTFGQLLIAGVMFWGRLGAMTIVVAILQRRTSEQLVIYPEESVLVG